MSTLTSRAGVALLILFAFVVFLQCEETFVELMMSEDPSPSGREQAAPIRSPAQVSTAVVVNTSRLVPDHITYALNAGYRSIPSADVEREIAAVSHWYSRTYGLTPKLPTHIRFEPECSDQWGLGKYAGTAERTEREDGIGIVDVCVRLDGDSSAAIQSDETKWVLAHEYFHALQANAGWADQLGGDCGEQLSEGSAEYFGQIYAFGKIDRVGLGDLLDAFFDPARFLSYEVGVEAFDALVKWKGERKAARFWESDLDRCADAFLVAFGVSPGKYEEDWSELTSE